jgi:hypothetical protein
MEILLETLKISGLGLLGILLYAFATVWKKIRQDGFSIQKFVGENVPFWAICLVLNLLFAVVIVVAPDFAQVLHFFGFAIESDNVGGFILLGITLAAGSDKTMITGGKKLNTKTP